MGTCIGGRVAKKDCAIGLIQIHSTRKDIESNLNEIVRRIQELAADKAELMIAPEVALTGWQFDMRDWHAVAQTIPGPATEEVGTAARTANAYVASGMVEKHGENIHNAVAVIGPNDSLVGQYRKTHLWCFENDIFTQGDEMCLVDMEFGIVAITICYDACFPEYNRALASNGANIIAHSTFWMANESFNNFGDKTEIYQSSCRTRAFDNQVYFASANRVGNDDFLYGLGNAMVMTPWGDVAGKLYQTPGTLVVKTEWEKMAE